MRACMRALFFFFSFTSYILPTTRMFLTWMWHLTCQTITNHRIFWILRRDCPVLIVYLCTHSTPLILSGMTVPSPPRVKVSSLTWLYLLLPGPLSFFFSTILLCLLYFKALVILYYSHLKMYNGRTFH